jgi:hypothetical protein
MQNSYNEEKNKRSLNLNQVADAKVQMEILCANFNKHLQPEKSFTLNLYSLQAK